MDVPRQRPYRAGITNNTKGFDMDMRPLVETAITANTAAFATFILAASMKRQGLLDAEAVIHLTHLLDQQLELLTPGTDVHEMHQRWRRKIAD